MSKVERDRGCGGVLVAARIGRGERGSAVVAATGRSSGAAGHPRPAVRTPASRITMRTDGTAVWLLAGELDIARAETLVEEGLDAVRQTATDVLIVDLTDVSFLDSYAVEGLDTVRVAARMQGRSLKLTGVDPRNSRVFSLVGLARVFGLDERSAPDHAAQ